MLVYTSITGITETYNTADLVTEITNALAITTGGVQTVTISGGSQTYAVSVEDLNAIAALTTGVVTARISAQSGTGMAGHLSNIDISDVITYAIFNGLTFSAEDLCAIVSKVDNLSLRLPNDDYVVTGATATAEEVNTLAVLATGTITSAVAADEASILNTALTDSDINNALTITATNVATDIADLIALNTKTTVSVGASAVVTITSAATTTIDLTAAGVTWASGINVTGTVQGDTITATSGNDIINGHAGADTITGGAGADIITGGSGNDTFVYASNSDSFGSSPFVEGTADWIKDFTANGASGDKIDLGGIVETVGGNVTGTVNKATMNNDMNALLNSTVLTDGWNVNNGAGIDAALVYIDGGDMAGRSFIAVALTGNDWFGANDLLIEVTGITETAFDINVFI